MNKAGALIALTTALLVGCGMDTPPDRQQTQEVDPNGDTRGIIFLTEDYPPLSFQRDGTVTGLSVAVVRALMERTDTAGEIRMVAWDEGYKRVLEQPDTALFSTVMTPERKEQLQWVGPIAALNTNLYALADSDIQVGSLEQVRDVDQIAAVTDYYSEQFLKQENFANIQSHASETEAVKALLEGDAQLLISSNTVLPATLEKVGAGKDDIRNALTLSTDLAYIAFSPDTSSERIEQWQAALDAMKQESTFKQIYARWLPGDLPPGRFQLVTEQYPPITFMKDGQPAGFVTDMVREITKRLDMDERVRLTTWENAYNMALLHPDVVLFSAERTPQREDKFHWVGPVGRNTAILYARRGADIDIPDLEAARQVETIGTTTDWFTEQYLEKEGFDNLVSSPDPADNVHKLMEGEVQLSIFTDITVGEIAREAGYSMADLEPVLPVTSTDFYIALSRDTSRDIVDAWQKTLDQMKADGTFREIYHQYLPDADIDDLVPDAQPEQPLATE